MKLRFFHFSFSPYVNQLISVEFTNVLPSYVNQLISKNIVLFENVPNNRPDGGRCRYDRRGGGQTIRQVRLDPASVFFVDTVFFSDLQTF